jgi:multidrug efflux pump subunit AcrA (membrane-fusion protein)
MSSDEALPPISRWTMICGLSFVGIVGTALTLAAIIQYPVKITATAVVRPIGELRFAQAPAEATIKSINAKENQLVRQGDVIATLDDGQLQIRKSQLVGTIQSNQAQLEQFDNQLSALATQRTAEEHQTNGEVQEVQADLNFAQTTYQRYQWLANQGAISLQQRDEKQQAYQTALTRIAQRQAKGQSTLAALDKERESLLQRRVELQNQLNRDHKDLKQVEIDITKYVIRAPEAGTLFKLDLRNVGQIVRPADAIAQIAPGSAPLVIKAQVATQDRSKVALNQKVHLRVNAFPYPDYGILPGKVVAITPDAIQPQPSSPTGQPGKAQAIAAYFEVTIQPEALSLRNDPKNAIQPGMEATAEIIAREETVLTFLLRKARLITDL